MIVCGVYCLLGVMMGTKKIKLYSGEYAIVDAEDCEMLSKHRWYLHRGRQGELKYFGEFAHDNQE